MSKLVQEQMFGMPNVIVVDFTPKAEVAVAPFDMDAWHKSIGGEWEQVQAAKAEAQKAGAK